MLTFEKVFSVFESFLAENGIYKVVSTSHGHTVLEWDSRAQEWIGVKLCATPEETAETLLDDLTGYLEYKATLGRRDLTYIVDALENQQKGGEEKWGAARRRTQAG